MQVCGDGCGCQSGSAAAKALAQVKHGLNGGWDALLQPFLNRGVEIGMGNGRHLRASKEFLGALGTGKICDADASRGNKRRDASSLGGKRMREFFVFFDCQFPALFTLKVPAKFKP